MAEIFEDIQTTDAVVTNLLSVQGLGQMRVGDLIVVSNATQSIPFRTGASNQILVTDSGTTSHLAWKGAKTLIGFTSSGQILTSGPGGALVVLNQGTAGQVLTVNSSRIPSWQTPSVSQISSGSISFSVEPGQVQTRGTGALGRNFSFFSWSDLEYGTGATATNSNMSLTAGNLVFWSDATTAKINAYRIGGAGVAKLFNEVTTTIGMNVVPVSSPSADSLYRFSASGSAGANCYAFQMHFKRLKVPVA